MYLYKINKFVRGTYINITNHVTEAKIIQHIEFPNFCTAVTTGGCI